MQKALSNHTKSRLSNLVLSLQARWTVLTVAQEQKRLSEIRYCKARHCRMEQDEHFNSIRDAENEREVDVKQRTSTYVNFHIDRGIFRVTSRQRGSRRINSRRRAMTYIRYDLCCTSVGRMDVQKIGVVSNTGAYPCFIVKRDSACTSAHAVRWRFRTFCVAHTFALST